MIYSLCQPAVNTEKFNQWVKYLLCFFLILMYPAAFQYLWTYKQSNKVSHCSNISLEIKLRTQIMYWILHTAGQLKPLYCIWHQRCACKLSWCYWGNYIHGINVLLANTQTVFIQLLCLYRYMLNCNLAQLWCCFFCLLLTRFPLLLNSNYDSN